jgi:hypothetical protein
VSACIPCDDRDPDTYTDSSPWNLTTRVCSGDTETNDFDATNGGDICENGYYAAAFDVFGTDGDDYPDLRSQGLCNECPLDTFESAEGECQPCSGSVLNSWSFPLLLLLATIGAGALLNFLVKKNLITLPTFHLNLLNMIRTKQLTAVMQVFQVFAGLSSLLAPWFLVIAAIFTQFSMPIEINPVCVSSFQSFSRGGWHFTSALITIFSVVLFVYFLLNASRIKCLKSRLDISAFEKMQTLAALVVIQAPLIVLPSTIKTETMAEDIRKVYYHYSGAASPYGADTTNYDLLAVRLVVNILTVISVAIVLSKITHGVTKKFNLLRKEVIGEINELRSIDDVIAQADEKREEDVKQLRFFYAAFCIQYAPSGVFHEEHAVMRKVQWTVLIKIVAVAEFMAYASVAREPYNMPAVGTALRCAAVVLVNVNFVSALLSRPYISSRRSKRVGDPTNDAELLTARTLSWSSAILALKVGISGETSSLQAAWIMDLICAGVLVGLLASQRPLFLGAVDVARDFALSRTSSLGGSEKPSSVESTEDKKKRHSGLVDAGSGFEIERMMDSSSFREILYYQAKLDHKTMNKEELARWKPEVNEETGEMVKKRGWCATKLQHQACIRAKDSMTALVTKHKCLKLVTWPLYLVFLLMAFVAVAFALLQLIILGADNVSLRWFAVLLPTAMCVKQEVTVWKYRKQMREENDSAVAASNAASGDDIEMVSNPVHRKQTSEIK